MDKKHKHQKGGKTHIPAADSFKNYDHAGWMSRLCHDGWLKKRWRKRYCVLSNGTLYLYEKLTAKGTESSNITIDLAKFSSCVKATGKESKKSPNTIVLEPTVSNNANGEKEQNNNNIAREFFFTEDAGEIDKWISKLKESLSLSCTGAKAKLEHVTKSRARPPRGGGGNRRPPTKQHIKERARMSEIAMDEEEEQPRKSAKESRGRIPMIAIKPTGKPILPNSSLTVGKKADAETLDDDTDAMPMSQKPPKEDKPDSAKTKCPPKLPPVALKPKSKPTDDSLISKSEVSDNSDENSEENLAGSESMDASADQSTDDKLEMNDKSEMNDKITKTPPKLPPVAMKPKFKQSETVENMDDDNDPVSDDDSKSSITDSEPSVDDPASTSMNESSRTQNKPLAFPPVALKPKVTPDKSKTATEEELPTQDSTNANGDEASGISRSNGDLSNDATHNEILQDNSIRKRKSLTDLKLCYEHKNTPNRHRSNSI